MKLIDYIKIQPFHKLLFYLFLMVLPFQIRTLFNADTSYISWYFNYHLAYFLYLSDILLIACFITWLLFDPPNAKESKGKLFWLTLGFIGVCIISVFHVEHLGLGIYQTLKWLEFALLVGYIGFTFRETFQFRLTLAIFFLSAMFQGILGFWQFHVKHMIGLFWLGEYVPPIGQWGAATIETIGGKVLRAYGTFPHPNVLAGMLIFGLVWGLFYVSHETKAKKWLIYAGLVMIIAGLFATFSRLGWVAGLAILGGFALYYIYRGDRRLAVGILILGIVSCGTLALVYKPLLKARVVEAQDRSLSDRYFFNDLGLKLIQQNPIFGVGMGNYVPALQSQEQLEAWQYQPAHNIFIFIAAELGLVGLAIFLWILYEIGLRLKNFLSDPMVFGFFLLFIIFLTLGQFDHYFVTIQQGRLMFATVLGLIAALPNLTNRNDS